MGLGLEPERAPRPWRRKMHSAPGYSAAGHLGRVRVRARARARVGVRVRVRVRVRARVGTRVRVRSAPAVAAKTTSFTVYVG